MSRYSPVNTTSLKDPGTRFTEGNHTVVVAATNSAGNVGTCEFTVEVKGELTLDQSASHPQKDSGTFFL